MYVCIVLIEILLCCIKDDFDQFWPEKNSLFTYDDIRITTIKDDQEKNCIITTIQTTKVMWIMLCPYDKYLTISEYFKF